MLHEEGVDVGLGDGRPAAPLPNVNPFHRRGAVCLKGGLRRGGPPSAAHTLTHWPSWLGIYTLLKDRLTDLGPEVVINNHLGPPQQFNCSDLRRVGAA